MRPEVRNSNWMERLWQRGQEHLFAGRYQLAVRELAPAEAAARRAHDAEALARLQLPLLEARRQIRQQAAEGTVAICDPAGSPRQASTLAKAFIHDHQMTAGTILLAGAPSGHWARAVPYEARRTGRCLEALLLLHDKEVRLCSAGDATFAAGLRVSWTRDPSAQVGAVTDQALELPLPPPGIYRAQDALHAVARETLIAAWEALALKWQHRHPPAFGANVWDEIDWLRSTLAIDPACEPASMRLMALAEAAGRK